MLEKIYRNTRTQIGILKSRGLIVKSKKKAKRTIKELNYYNLINGYKDPFINRMSNSEKFISGATFDEVVSLYEFDRKLRILVLEYILQIEKHVKSQTAACFSKKFGHKNYLNTENFDCSNVKKYEQVCKLLSQLHNSISSNLKYDLSTIHYISNKNYLPLWVLVNAISMGDISKFYTNCQQSIRNEIAKNICYGIREHQLSNCLYFIASIRNRCAHDERLYSYLSNVHLTSNVYFNYYKIKTHGNNFFALMVSFKMILSKKKYNEFHNHVDELITDLSLNLNSIGIGAIRSSMGLPSNWKKLLNL